MFDLGFAAVGLSPDGPLDTHLFAALLNGYTAAGGEPIEERTLHLGCAYACAVLMFRRYARHTIEHPDETRTDLWRELLPFMNSVHP
jgi:hypothetical protein